MKYETTEILCNYLICKIYAANKLAQNLYIQCRLFWIPLHISLYPLTVSAGVYGVPKPWYFPFMKSYWCSSKPRTNTISSSEMNSHTQGYRQLGGEVRFFLLCLRFIFIFAYRYHNTTQHNTVRGELRRHHSRVLYHECENIIVSAFHSIFVPI